MGNKNTTPENLIDEDFVLSHLVSLVNGNIVVLEYSRKFLDILQAIINSEQFKRYTIRVSIIEGKMNIKLEKYYEY